MASNVFHIYKLNDNDSTWLNLAKISGVCIDSTYSGNLGIVSDSGNRNYFTYRDQAVLEKDYDYIVNYLKSLQ